MRRVRQGGGLGQAEFPDEWSSTSNSTSPTGTQVRRNDSELASPWLNARHARNPACLDGQPRAVHGIAPAAPLAHHRTGDARRATGDGSDTSIGVRAIPAIDDITLPTEHPVLAEMRDTYLSLPGDRI